ncbi:hypothetical protein EVAR_68708_1 [Eumeta japonica]|uniref:Uncharacterized protein n=1 Tax=Eumeta variegata TaxID=151549 RepID=A0A4C1ZXB8_EUMVA|nr:hypothetical protein EVAR_68708_1 [Eumeta japonica]
MFRRLKKNQPDNNTRKQLMPPVIAIDSYRSPVQGALKTCAASDPYKLFMAFEQFPSPTGRCAESWGRGGGTAPSNGPARVSPPPAQFVELVFKDHIPANESKPRYRDVYQSGGRGGCRGRAVSRQRLPASAILLHLQLYGSAVAFDAPQLSRVIFYEKGKLFERSFGKYYAGPSPAGALCARAAGAGGPARPAAGLCQGAGRGCRLEGAPMRRRYFVDLLTNNTRMFCCRTRRPPGRRAARREYEVRPHRSALVEEVKIV